MIQQYQPTTRDYKYFYELHGLQWDVDKEYKSTTLRADSLEELEGLFNGNAIEDDADLL